MEIPVHHKIEQEYQAIRQENEELRQKRLQEVYLRLPRVRQIDEETVRLNAAMARELFSGGKGKMETARSQVKSLLAERKRLLTGAGYEENHTAVIYTCPLCQDTGYIRTKPCRCYREKRLKYLYEYANISPVMQQQSFDSFRFDYYSKKAARGVAPFDNVRSIYQTCRDFAEKKECRQGKNLFLYGPAGIGKTFLCSCIAKKLLEQDEFVFYQSAYKIFSSMEEFKFKYQGDSALERVIKMLYETPVLIIDDLGTEFITSYTSAALFDILNSRLMNKKSTVISTNLSMNDLGKLYSPRVQSRILGEYTLLKFDGTDIRKQKLLD